MLRKTLFLDFINACTYVPVFLYLEAKEGIPYIIDMSETPSIALMIKSIIVMVVLDDFLSFLTHRLFHIGPLYTYFHKLHHEYHTTVAIASLHTHIVEALAAGGLPTKIYIVTTAYLFGPIHFSTIIIWNLLRLYEGYTSHSGYMFSWSPSQILPFCANDGYHDFHHSHNCGNYGAQLRIWDVVFGSSKPFK
jgi:sterol desaturase/sphingolipid hydroxylase (fatty acid hydroxylase superfamily)